MQKDLFEIVFTCLTNGDAGTRGGWPHQGFALVQSVAGGSSTVSVVGVEQAGSGLRSASFEKLDRLECRRRHLPCKSGRTLSQICRPFEPELGVHQPRSTFFVACTTPPQVTKIKCTEAVLFIIWLNIG
jgi:hypothetical protein